MTVTASQLKSFHGKERTTVLEKADRDNLSIRLSKKGKVSFYLRFKLFKWMDGKTRWETIEG